MRGFTMILVVFSHIIVFILSQESTVNNIFIKFRMPLFFFISGIMSYSKYDKPLIYRRIYNRFFGQLLPTIILLILYSVTFNIPLEKSFFSDFKSGYWFTIVIVEAFLFYLSVVLCFNKFNIAKHSQAIILIFFMALSGGISFFCSLFQINNELMGLFSVNLLMQYLPFYLLGILSKMYMSIFERLINNGVVVGIVIVLFVALSDVRFVASGKTNAVLGIILVYAIFYKYQNVFSNNTIIGRQLILIGNNTLEIYLLHYFVVNSMRGLSEFLNKELIFSSWLSELLFPLVLSLVVVYVCFLVINIIKISPQLYKLLFGFKR